MAGLRSDHPLKKSFSQQLFKLNSRNRRFVSPASAFLFLFSSQVHCYLEVWRPTPHAWENRSRRNDIRRCALQVLKRFTQFQRHTFLIVFIFSGFGAAQWTILWWRWVLMGKSWVSCNLMKISFSPSDSLILSFKHQEPLLIFIPKVRDRPICRSMVLHKDNAGRFWLLTSPISFLKLMQSPLLTWNWSDLASRSSEAPLLPLQLTLQLPRMDFSLGITSLVIINMPTDSEDQSNTTSRCRSWRSVCCWVRRQRAWQALWGGRPGFVKIIKIDHFHFHSLP